MSDMRNWGHWKTLIKKSKLPWIVISQNNFCLSLDFPRKSLRYCSPASCFLWEVIPGVKRTGEREIGKGGGVIQRWVIKLFTAPGKEGSVSLGTAGEKRCMECASGCPLKRLKRWVACLSQLDIACCVHLLLALYSVTSSWWLEINCGGST